MQNVQRSEKSVFSSHLLILLFCLGLTFLFELLWSILKTEMEHFPISLVLQNEAFSIFLVKTEMEHFPFSSVLQTEAFLRFFLVKIIMKRFPSSMF